MRNETKKLPKMIVVLGPTACGKTSWSLRLSKEFNGEVVSADSRQVFKYMNVGTAKEPGEWKRNSLRKSYVIDGVIHHLIDFLNPGKTFTVAEFRDKAIKYAKIAHKAGRIPMLVGGTGLYLSSVIDNFHIPRIPPHKKMRRSLEEKNKEQLLKLLQTLDPKATETIDVNNKRRLIRALEVTIISGIPFSEQKKKGEQLFDVLQIGIDVPRETLYDRIDTRVDQMMEEGLLDEIKFLLRKKYHWDLSSMKGIGYQEFRKYFEEEEPIEIAVERLKKNTRQYARRQGTWFRRDERIQWCVDYEEAEKLVRDFLA
ncbi:MAG: tRNA (adenosine(37)-N6)-dimethylallyltransferase MiaA [Candidatus Magasanikbacteria bacterium]